MPSVILNTEVPGPRSRELMRLAGGHKPRGPAPADPSLHLCFMVTLYEPYVRLAQKLNEITPGSFAKKTMLFNSGSEAVENAVKVAPAPPRPPAIITFARR